MMLLQDSSAPHDLDHSPVVRSTTERRQPCAPVSGPQEVYRQALDTFEPDDRETLIRSVAASSSESTITS